MSPLPVNTGLRYEPLRRLFDEHGSPGLGPQRRGAALGVSDVATVVHEALHGTHGLAHDRLLALAWGWHDHWEESHSLCQSHEGDQDSDFVHMVLHRREPDAANCRYWIDQVGWHPLYDGLPSIAEAGGLADLAPAGRWNPELFLERCLRSAEHHPDHHALVALQAAELLALRDRLLSVFCQPDT